jgi:hypothetical protein
MVDCEFNYVFGYMYYYVWVHTYVWAGPLRVLFCRPTASVRDLHC